MDSDGIPLRDASVVVLGSGTKVSFTKNEAIFRTILPAGAHSVRVSVPGFKEQTMEVVVKTGRLEHVTFVMGTRHVPDKETEHWLKNLGNAHHSIATVIKYLVIFFSVNL